MKKSIIAMLALGALSIVFITGMAQPPGEKGPKKGPPPDKKGPGWEPGKIIPPHVRDVLDLTEDQERKISALEDEVRLKLLKIFTDEQKQRLKELNDKGPKGPPKDKDFPPDKKGKGKGDKDKDKDRDRRDNEEVKLECPRVQNQLYATRLIDE
jgi:hypothetical protein